MKTLDKLNSQLQLLPESLQGSVALQLERLIQNTAAVAWLDPVQPELLGSICKVWACSEFVSRYCVTHPERFRELVENGVLQRAYHNGELASRLRELLQPITDQTQLSVSIRQFRQREMVRIAWRDIAGWADLAETLEDLSALADSCVALALEKLQHWLEQSLGQPCDSKGNREQLVGEMWSFGRPRRCPPRWVRGLGGFQFSSPRIQ